MRALEQCHLYGIVDLGYIAAEEAPAFARQMLEGGVDVLQLRAKNTSLEAVKPLGAELRKITGAAGVPFIVNDHPQLVPLLGAQGAHVGQDDVSIADARVAMNTPGSIVGKSTHNLEQALAAAAEGADYIGFGPLFATATKPDYFPIGVTEISRVHELVTVPIFCIGGIKLENLPQVIAAGARRVVIVSGILQAPDVAGYCRTVKRLLNASLS